MRASVITLFAVLLASTAAAGTISSIDPAQVEANTGEYLMTISGRDLGTMVVFSGPADDFELEASSAEEVVRSGAE